MAIDNSVIKHTSPRDIRRDISRDVAILRDNSPDKGLVPKAPDSFYQRLGAQGLTLLGEMVLAVELLNGKSISVKAGQLPQLLASFGLNPHEIVGGIYNLLRKTLAGKFTPGQDNAIHVDKELFLSMAKDPTLTADIAILCDKVAKNKSWACLTEPLSKSLPPEAPGLRHNPGIIPTEQVKRIPTSLKIFDPKRFIEICGERCGIAPTLVSAAFHEKSILKGDG
ncbi:hypothetical protein A3J90_01105 [candidate division WOR-1 bacterium RIFOXYC2_FULL_37_10]|uniref:Uncharacterized protein n=1 Tax=candidate division WOR-1 bacterium RIFOXYB2_FULL_37_13 TaxID=1802579 RepID=A0A1F4STM7_UNCSA|nr:MAG: hypothetical protein A2246_04345 [candidate division WOR-1 bacterium RIFOXYA2_FULL_37_7]OGC23795.1 MAG: hypothetical protein A2310_04170 [candidate division WOR-1 bacterium RIFOXYB2_FULL_37_13]OGC33303.1 MAG: hypothetical protein A3J90_01105 [candidate division WOR-1 bacterium RIFOXYC2_FULL_37_10]